MMVRKWTIDTSRLWLAVMIAALLGLAPLAWLQYRWIGQISQAEGERMQAHLRAEAARLVQDFDGELTRVHRALLGGGGPGGGPGEDLDVLAERFTRFSENASDRRLVRSLYVSRGGEEGTAELYRLNATAGRFEKIEWPGNLIGLRGRLAGMGVGPGQLQFSSVEPNIPALFAPRMARLQPGPPPRREGPQGRRFRALAGWAIVELDLAFIRDELMPELVRKHFSQAGEAPFDIRVVSGSDRSRVIYASNPSLAADFTVVDLTIGMFELRPGPFQRFRGAPGALPQEAGPGEPRGGWLLLAKHHSGSLEEVTGQTRRRNVAISFAILLILGASLLALVFTTRRAQRLANLQMEFIAGVSHELRTPLTVICSAAENLADGVVSSPQQMQRYGTVIRAEGRRLSQMVEQILRFAGIQSGKAKYEMQNVSVRTLIERTMFACEPEIQAAGVEVETTIADDLPDISADSTSLTHCLRNLVDNAVTHGAQGKWAGIRARAAGGGVEIQIEDRGRGIAPEELKHIFDAFYRGRRSIEDQVRGFGLGMALAKRIVTAHSGTITVESTLGKGACVTVRLPAAAPAQESEASGTTNTAG